MSFLAADRPALPMVHVVGLGLEDLESLTTAARNAIEQADILVGAERHLACFPDHSAQRWPLGNLQSLLVRLQQQMMRDDCPRITILTTGDPLFFGLGRLLLTVLPAEQLIFHPNVSAVQLAFSRLRMPWQQAHIVSIHGRKGDLLSDALAQGKSTIAVIGDPQVLPAEIAAMVTAAPYPYRIWCCENLGSPQERVQCYDPPQLPESVAPLHIWVLQKQQKVVSRALPLLGIDDDQFARFEDRPGLMTKRPVRVLALAELDLRAEQIIWDIGAGTGSVSVEIARLMPSSCIYAIEKSAAGCQLIQANRDRFNTPQVVPVAGAAPEAFSDLPDPHRIFVGGHGGSLAALLDAVTLRLLPGGRMVVATTTLESQAQLMTWLQREDQDRPGHWSQGHLQVNLSRATPVGRFRRMSPLNPVMLTVIARSVDL